MDSSKTIVDSCSNDFFQELKKLKNHTYTKGINEDILNKFLSSRFEHKYKFYIHKSEFECRKIYDNVTNVSCNFVNICFPYQSIIISCSHSVAMNLSGINNILNYDKTFIRFKTINEDIICKSGPIIICKLPLDSIICLSTNTPLSEYVKIN